MKTKICKWCNTEKLLISFSRNRTRRDGLQDYCKACNGEINKQWLNQHREEYKEYQAEWYRKNRGRLRGKMADYAKTPTERYRQIKRRAKIRNVELTITRGEFVAWFKVQLEVCHYCGSQLTAYKNGSLQGLTVDRKNNAKGYNVGNLVLACMRCNVMKGSWLTEGQMIDAATRYFKPLIEGVKNGLVTGAIKDN